MYKSFERSKSFKRFKKYFGFLLTKKPKIVFRGKKEDIDTPTLFLCNHGLNGAQGLYANEIHFPFKFAPIGRFEVFQSFRKRWNYLYTFNHRLRRGLGKFKAFCAATFEALFSKSFYKYCRAIPSYRDYRLKSTFKEVFRCLNEGISIMVYPEKLEMGYNNIFVEYASGFVSMARQYYHRYQKEVKVCAVYYSGSTNQTIIDEQISIMDLLNEGKKKEDIAKYMVQRTNQLYIDYIQPIHDAAEERHRKRFNTDDFNK